MNGTEKESHAAEQLVEYYLVRFSQEGEREPVDWPVDLRTGLRVFRESVATGQWQWVRLEMRTGSGTGMWCGVGVTSTRVLREYMTQELREWRARDAEYWAGREAAEAALADMEVEHGEVLGQ